MRKATPARAPAASLRGDARWGMACLEFIAFLDFLVAFGFFEIFTQAQFGEQLFDAVRLAHLFQGLDVPEIGKCDFVAETGEAKD